MGRLLTPPRRVLLALLSAILGLAACTGVGPPGWSPTATVAPPGRALASPSTAQAVVTGDTGTTLRLSGPAGTLAGLTVRVPPGALGRHDAVMVRVRAQAEPAPVAIPAAGADPRFVQTLLDAVDQPPPSAAGLPPHPLWSPALLLAGTQLVVGPTIELEPAGATFAQPVTVTVPSAAVTAPGDTGDLFFVLGSRQPDGTLRWEVLAGVERDPRSGDYTVAVPHFSVLSWLRNARAYPFRRGLTSPDTTARALRATLVLPDDLLERFTAATACADRQVATRPITLDGSPARPPRAMPDYGFLMDYLGFNTRRLDSGAEQPLRAWITRQFEVQWAAEKERPGSGKFETITLDDLYRQALDLAGGDVFMALVTAHNVLRDHRDSPGVQDMMAPIRGDGHRLMTKQRGGDEVGARYHFFGMAVYGYAQAYHRQHGSWLDPRRLATPDWAAWAEEAFVSGDIFSDPKEYAIDLAGGELGRQLYAEVADGAARQNLAQRWSVTAADCRARAAAADGAAAPPAPTPLAAAERVAPPTPTPPPDPTLTPTRVPTRTPTAAPTGTPTRPPTRMPAVTPTASAPPAPFFILLLTNASEGLYLGTEESLKGRTRCSFEGGGINCKASDVVTARALLGPFPTKTDAQAALCRAITERKVFPLGIGLKGRWMKTDTWYGLWDPSVTGPCPK